MSKLHADFRDHDGHMNISKCKSGQIVYLQMHLCIVKYRGNIFGQIVHLQMHKCFFKSIEKIPEITNLCPELNNNEENRREENEPRMRAAVIQPPVLDLSAGRPL